MISRSSLQITINFSTDVIRRKSVAIMSDRIKNSSPIFSSQDLKEKSNSFASNIKRKSSSILSKSFVWIGTGRIPKLDIKNIVKKNKINRCYCPTSYGDYDVIFSDEKIKSSKSPKSSSKSKKWSLFKFLFGSRCK